MTILWKPIAIGMLLALIALGGVMGWNWYLAARDRDAVQVELDDEREKNAALIVSLTKQNDAVDALAGQKSKAEARGAAAQALAAANGKRYAKASAQVHAVKATTCAEAMPAVNAVLEAIQ